MTQNCLTRAVWQGIRDAYYPGSALFDLEHVAFMCPSEPDLCPDSGHFPTAEPLQVRGLLSSISLCFGFLFGSAGLVKNKKHLGEKWWRLS